MAFLLLLVLWVLLFTGDSGNLRAVNAEEIPVTPDWLEGGTPSYDRGFDSSQRQNQICDETLGECDDKNESEEFVMESDEVVHGRLLRRVCYYINYGALRVDRVTCRPRSKRSYYRNLPCLRCL